MKKIILTTLLFILLSIFYFNFNIIKGNANSAVWMYDEGSSNHGVYSKDKNCPIVIEKEDLDFYISDDLPDEYDINYVYKDYVSAKYTMYNPTNEKIKATLFFPYLDTENYDEYFKTDESKYKIKVNDQEVDKKIRFSYGDLTNYSINNLYSISDEYQEYIINDNILNENSILYHYTVTIDNSINEFFLALNEDHYKSDIGKLAIIDELSVIDGSSYYGAKVSRDKVFDIYTYKKEYFSSLINWFTLYDTTECMNDVSSHLVYDIDNYEEVSFKELIDSYRDKDLGISQLDYYNAIIYSYYLVELYSSLDTLDINDELVKYYQYDIEINPNERITNEVEAPIIPMVKSTSSSKYRYTYVLSPVNTFDGFSNLTINVHTNKKMRTNNDYFDYEQTAYGYKVFIEKLEEGDDSVDFTIGSNSGCSELFTRSLVISLAFFVVIGVVIPLIGMITIVLVVRHADKKKNEEKNN